MWIELDNIHKHYGSVKANDGISFTVREGSIHAILGENGAGKSTLMKILSGYIPRTSGTLKINGKPVNFRRPAHATRAGIGMLYQDPMDFPLLSVIDNFLLGLSSGHKKRKKNPETGFRELCGTLGFTLSPETPVNQLTVGERQQLEILRLLAAGSEVLILDEPTTGISTEQKEILFRALTALKAEGKSVIIVSHKLEDVEALCDRVTVLRQGQVAGEMEAPFDADAVLAMMFAHVPSPPPRPGAGREEPVLEMRGISASGGRTGLSGCDITIRAGEVVGLAGLEGSGQGVFLRTAAGLKRPHRGTLHITGRNLTGSHYLKYRQAGVTFLPTDRLEEGLVPGMSITEHAALIDPGTSLLVPRATAHQSAKDRIRIFRIKGAPHTRAEALSGGNQQRLLLSFLPAAPKLLLLENPTRGLDVESANWVWEYLHQFCERSGTAIVFASPEIDEIMTAAHRVLVFFDGRVIMDTPTGNTSTRALGRAIAGKPESHPLHSAPP